MICLANAVGQGFLYVVLLMWLAIYSVNWWSKKLDGDGAVKKVAKQGFVNMLTRWMK